MGPWLLGVVGCGWVAPETTPSCEAGCPEGTFCGSSLGLCGAGDDIGSCVALPTQCPDEGPPVCGCDGELYANACEATRSGVSIREVDTGDTGAFDCG